MKKTGKTYILMNKLCSLGTTWTQTIALLVKFDGDASKLEGKFVHKEVPSLLTTAPMPGKTDQSPEELVSATH